MKKLLILQTVSPDYRKKVFQYIKNNLGNSFNLYSGYEYFENSVKTDRSIPFLKPVNNHFLLNRKFLFQTGMWKEAFNNEVLVLEMNPRILSNWILLFLRNFSSKKTILWGHAWPRNGKDSRSDKVRNLMRSLASEIIVYTKTQAKELQEKMPEKIIRSAPNSVFNRIEMQASQRTEKDINDIIYVGRLTKAKKPIFLVKAFIKVIEKLPQETKLIIVGEGEEKSKIEELVSKKYLKNRIKVLGHIGEYDKLKELYSKSLFSVSPGYVGLSITQSFGFGVPMLISKDENHSPEIEAAEKDKNALFFITDDIDDLNIKMTDFFKRKSFWINQKNNICNICIENYSVERMAETFIDLSK
ncbi:MAG: glycosyltransferase [Bacteroidota bacterium]